MQSFTWPVSLFSEEMCLISLLLAQVLKRWPKDTLSGNEGQIKEEKAEREERDRMYILVIKSMSLDTNFATYLPMYLWLIIKNYNKCIINYTNKIGYDND